MAASFSCLVLLLSLSLSPARASESCNCASELEAMRKDLDYLRTLVLNSAPVKGTETLVESHEVPSTTAAAHPQRRTSAADDGSTLEFSRGSSSIQFDARDPSSVTKLEFKYQGTEQCWIERVHSTGTMSFGVQGQEQFTLSADGTAAFHGKVAVGQTGIGAYENSARKFDLNVPEGIAFGKTYTYPMVRSDGGGNLELISNAYPAYTNLNHHISIKAGTSGGGGPRELARFSHEGQTLWPNGEGEYHVKPLARVQPSTSGDWIDYYSPSRGESGFILLGNINTVGGEYRYVATLWFSAAYNNDEPILGVSASLEEKIGAHMLDFRAYQGKIQISNTYGYGCRVSGVVHSLNP